MIIKDMLEKNRLAKITSLGFSLNKIHDEKISIAEEVLKLNKEYDSLCALVNKEDLGDFLMYKDEERNLLDSIEKVPKDLPEDNEFSQNNLGKRLGDVQGVLFFMEKGNQKIAKLNEIIENKVKLSQRVKTLDIEEKQFSNEREKLLSKVDNEKGV
jgi:hypothetical protein